MANNKTFQLSSEFENADEAQWLSLLDKALKGRPPESINSKTYDGLTIKALYRDTDWESSTDKSGLPGQSPFIRGASPSKDKYLPWDIRQIVSHPSPTESNKSILEDLENGVSSIEFRIDENGERGVCIRTLEEFKQALNGVKLDWAPVGLDVTAASIESGLAASAFLASYARENSDDVSQTKLAFNYDPIGTLTRSGHFAGTQVDIQSNITDIVESLSSEFQNSTILRADSRPVHEAGGSEAQELASLISTATQYTRMLVEKGVSPEKAIASINFTVAIGADYIVEIAKLRAARRMWAKVAEEFGVKEQNFKMTIQAVSSRRMLTARDPWVNILRNTAACFAAGVGGADIVTIRNFTDALGLPSPQARRIARNTHIIAQEESSLGKVLDPSGGTWSIASLSDEIALKAWGIFQSYEAEGGYISAIQNGTPQLAASNVRTTRVRDIAYRKVQVTGVSDFPLLDENEAEYVKPDLKGVLSKAAQATGQKPSSFKINDLIVSAQKGLTISELTPSSEDNLEADPFWPMRLAKSYENLRDYAEKSEKKTGKTPSVFIAALGPLAEHTARTSFATNFFAAGGLKAVYHTGSADELAKAFENSDCLLACICGSDDRYLQEAADTARELGAAGVGRLYLAGKPPAETRDAWQEAGMDEFIHIGVDVVASLELAHSELGLAL
ncbi:methylmalonyl-CoA mutase family protein [Hirschia maritima]|uniref:methylmalonyl-CoA mutase family protein n=1 Tax=Hirschia maritima TaxID=1121961 RepID=UPI00035FAE02|nr:methylmalonyl-CoA mutase family protein [Hirschia maritima]